MVPGMLSQYLSLNCVPQEALEAITKLSDPSKIRELTHRIHRLSLHLPYTSSGDYNCIQSDQSVFWFPDLRHKNHCTIYLPGQQLFMISLIIIIIKKQTKNQPTNKWNKALRLDLFIALWAVLHFTEEGGGKGRESGENEIWGRSTLST